MMSSIFYVCVTPFFYIKKSNISKIPLLREGEFCTIEVISEKCALRASVGAVGAVLCLYLAAVPEGRLTAAWQSSKCGRVARIQVFPMFPVNKPL
jgi:hypothetical protein